jgi:hypothetical protein
MPAVEQALSAPDVRRGTPSADVAAGRSEHGARRAALDALLAAVQQRRREFEIPTSSN